MSLYFPLNISAENEVKMACLTLVWHLLIQPVFSHCPKESMYTPLLSLKIILCYEQLETKFNLMGSQCPAPFHLRKQKIVPREIKMACPRAILSQLPFSFLFANITS